MNRGILRPVAILLSGICLFPIAACRGGETPAMGTPASPEAWVERYNAARSLQCVYAGQHLTSGVLRAGGAISIDLLSKDALRAVAEWEGNRGASLPKLESSDVETVYQEGTAVTFRLKEITLSAQDAEQGRGGYVNIIDRDRAAAIIDGAKEYFHIANANVELKSVTHTLTDGVLTAVFDSSLTGLESVRFTARQRALAELFYVLHVQADLTYALRSEYR